MAQGETHILVCAIFLAAFLLSLGGVVEDGVVVGVAVSVAVGAAVGIGVDVAVGVVSSLLKTKNEALAEQVILTPAPHVSHLLSMGMKLFCGAWRVPKRQLGCRWEPVGCLFRKTHNPHLCFGNWPQTTPKAQFHTKCLTPWIGRSQLTPSSRPSRGHSATAKGPIPEGGQNRPWTNRPGSSRYTPRRW